jgi:Txe/YoeB family toxin of Txe-Axe toxin-antitoxin module
VLFASLEIGKKGRNRINRKNRLIYETQEEIFWLKFSLKILKLLFSTGKITKNISNSAWKKIGKKL